MKISHEFVEFIPETIEENTLYISIKYHTAAHTCFCGCGQKVVTPLSPSDWKLIYDGKTVSLSPSVGNWCLPCRSHYIIQRSQVIIAPEWSEWRIGWNRRKDKREKKKYYRDLND